MTLTLLVDVVMAGLLLATIGYAIRLNSKLSTIQESRQQLQKLADDFTSSFAYAENSVIALQKVAAEVSLKLDQQSKEASQIRDEIAFLVDRGEAICNHLEDSIRRGKAMAGNAPSPTDTSPKEDRVSQTLKIVKDMAASREATDKSVGNDLLRALKSMR